MGVPSQVFKLVVVTSQRESYQIFVPGNTASHLKTNAHFNYAFDIMKRTSYDKC